MSKVSNFAVMERIQERDGAIAAAPLSNMISLDKTKHGFILTIGLDHEWGMKIFRDEVLGALHLVERDEFDRTKAEMEAEEST